jgi:hypothetical protein
MSAIVDLLIKAKYEAGQAFKTLDTEFDRLTNKARSMTDGFMNIKAGFDMVGDIAGKVIQVFNDVTSSVIEYGDQVDTLSRLIGASAEESSKLIQAADDVKVNVETLQSALEVAIRKGISPTIEGIGKLSDQYRAIQNPIERSKFLMDNFGRSGADLARFMELGSQGMRDAGLEAEKLGLVLDRAAIERVRQLERAVDDMNDKWDAGKLKMGLEVVPVVNSFLETMLRADDAVQEHRDSWVSMIPYLSEAYNLYLLIREAIGVAGDEAEKSAKEFEEAAKQAASFQSYAGSVPVVGHGRTYRAGEGPAYPWSESNPTGYVLDRMGNRTYPGRAAGGTVVAGATYMVGEHGPEPVTFGSSGYVGAMPTKSGDVNISVQVKSVIGPRDTAEAERIISPAIESTIRKLKRNGQIQ